MGPSTVESTYSLAEDPVIWFSGGQYHVLYDYPDDRVGYHLTSTDGIHDWTDQGWPTIRGTRSKSSATPTERSTTGTRWSGPACLVENGHVTYVTFAVSDVDKNNQIPAGSDHGSKVIVVPFDGVTFDKDTGLPERAEAGGRRRVAPDRAGTTARAAQLAAACGWEWWLTVGGGAGGSTATGGHGGGTGGRSTGSGGTAGSAPTGGAGGSAGTGGTGGSVVGGQGGSGTGGSIGTGGRQGTGGSGSGGITDGLRGTPGNGGTHGGGLGRSFGDRPLVASLGTGGAGGVADSGSSGCSCAVAEVRLRARMVVPISGSRWASR